MIGIADIHSFFAAALKSPRALATLPFRNFAVDAAMLASFNRRNGMSRNERLRRKGGRTSGRAGRWVRRSRRWLSEAIPWQALANGAAGFMIRIPTHASRAGLADDAIGSVAHEETVLMIGIADIHSFFAAALKSPRALATLPFRNFAVDTAVLATFNRQNGVNRRTGRTDGIWLH